MIKKHEIQQLQKLDIGPLQMAMIALVILGKKPAAEVTLYHHNTNVQVVVKTLSDIGLTVRCAWRSSEPDSNRVAILCVSNDPNYATLLERLVQIKNSSRGELGNVYHVAYDSLMGYPLSAIEGYITGKMLEEGRYPDNLKEDSLAVFKLSKENWSEEAGVIASWRQALELYAPNILQRLDRTFAR